MTRTMGTGTLHEDRYTFMIISPKILLRMRNVSNKSYIENQNILCAVNVFRKSWENVEKYGMARWATDDNITNHMHFACWITKGTDNKQNM